MEISKTMKLVGILLLPLSLSAETVTWLKGADGKWDGDWSDKTRWSTGELPTAADTAVFPRDMGDVATITVNDTYEVGSLDVAADTGAVGRRYDVTLKGSGQITLVGKDGSGFSTWVRERRSLTLDGVSLVDTGWQDLMIRGRITVKDGALLKNTRIAKLVYYDSECIIDGGRFEFSEFQYNGAEEGTSAPWPMRLVLNGGSISGGHIYGYATKPFSVEINDGTMKLSGQFSLKNEGSVLAVSGGSMTVTDTRFSILAGASLMLTDGALQFPNANSVDAAANVSLTGGVLTLGAVTEDPRFNGVSGVTLRYDLGTSAYTKHGSVPVVADTIRLERFETDSDAGSVLHGKFRNIVFSAPSEPFRFGNGNQRHFYLEGPTTIRAENDQTDTLGSTWYTHLEGDFIVDTRDADGGETPLHLSLWSTASRWGTASLTVRGGGSLCLLQHDSASTFRFISVEEDTALNLAKRGNGTEWGPVSTERFTLGANAKVTLDAKYNHIVAETFEIDPTATIEVTIGDAPTCGAFAILQSPNGTTPSAAYVSQISLKGNTDGWALKAEDGQITLYKAGKVTDDYPTEWIGKGENNKVNTQANFVSALPAEKVPLYFGADETQKTAEWAGPIADGYTLGGVWFLETAINTFGYISHGETGYNEPFFCSYSGVPQKHLEGSFRTPFLQMATRGHGPLVFEGTTQNWGGNYYYDVTKPESEWSYWQWRNRGDCRINKPLFNMRNFAFYGMNAGYGNYSRFTVLANSVVDVQDLYSELTGSATGFRVEEGGLLKFTDTLASAHQGERRYKWTVSPAGQIVNGTMDIQTPFVGGATQAYGGRGTLKIATTVPSTAASRVWLMDALTTELASDWQTVTATADTPLALGAIAGNPVVKVPNGWRYEAGAETATAAADRAIEIREGATLTIDAGVGMATVAEPVVGPGTLKAAAGTTLALSAGNTAAVCLKGGSSLVADSPMTVGPLTVESGAKLALASDVVLTVNGDVSLAGAPFAFADAAPTRWTTVLVCSGGTVTGGEYEDVELKTRIATDELGRQVVQCKAQSGMMLIVR